MDTRGVQPEDTAHLRKAHPCGGKTWRVTRIGADIGLECLTCGRRVMLTRDEFERRCVRLDSPPSADK
jgi:Uncharacterized protein conserved in bacteria